MGPRYSRFSGSPIGAQLELQQGQQAVTTEAGSLNIERTARGGIGVNGRDSFVEFFIYGTIDDIAGKVSVGVCTASQSASEYVGQSDQGVGYRVGDGAIYHDGASIESVATGALKSIVSMLVTFGPTPQVTFWLNADLQAVIDIPSEMLSVPLYYAVSIGSDVAGDIIVQANTGDRRPTFPSPVADGWSETLNTPSDLRVSTADYISAPTDTPPNVAFDGHIAAVSAILTRKLSFWPSGDAPLEQRNSLVLTLDNIDGRYNGLIGGRYRDLPVRVRAVDEGGALATSDTIGTFVFDRAEILDGRQVRITAVDDTVLLSKPSQTRLFPPFVIEEAANRPWPTLIGSMFSVPLFNFDDDGTTLSYAIDSEGISFSGRVRDKGDPWNPLAPDFDYTITDNGTTLQTTLQPLGIVTMDASATGGEYVPPAPVDLLGGIGDPFAGTVSAAPTGWTTAGAQPPVYSGGGEVSFPYVVNTQGNMTATGITTSATKTYLYRLVIEQMQRRFDGANIGSRIGIGHVAGAMSGFAFFEAMPNTTFPVVIEGTIAPGAARPIYISHINSNQVGGEQTIISHFSMIELATGDTSESDAELEASQPALPLELIVAELFRRTSRSADSWNRSSVAAIDTETGFAGGGYYAPGQYTDADALRTLLPGWNASCFKDEDGILQFTMLVAPEDETATHSLDASQMLGEMLPQFDTAPGLTTAVVCRPNGIQLSDSDLVTDEAEVTISLRRKLNRPYRYQRAAGAQVASGYEHATSAEPLQTNLTNPDDAQALIEHAVGVYAKSRAYYTARLPSSDAPPLGAIVNVTYPDYGMQGGAHLRCVEIQQDLTDQRECVVVLWGLSPEELE